jgi:plastocyanin
VRNPIGHDARSWQTMSRTLAAAVAVAAFGLVLAGLAGAEGPKLIGSVGPGFVISLTDAQGNRVTQLNAGPYEFEIDDRAEEHNFHLLGPGVDRSTPVETTAKVTWQVTLQDGTYTFVCDPHSLQMRGMFQVGAQPPPPPPPPPQPPPPPPPTVTPKPSAAVGAKLALTVGPGFTISLKTLAGKKVTALARGAYTVVVRDRSSAHNARLLGAGAAKFTTVAFKGSRTWKVTLRRGTLVFQCDPHRSSMRGAVRIL